MEKKVVSFKAAKYEKMYADFYRNHKNLGFFNKYDIVKTKVLRLAR